MWSNNKLLRLFNPSSPAISSKVFWPKLSSNLDITDFKSSSSYIFSINSKHLASSLIISSIDWLIILVMPCISLSLASSLKKSAKTTFLFSSYKHNKNSSSFSSVSNTSIISLTIFSLILSSWSFWSE